MGKSIRSCNPQTHTNEKGITGFKRSKESKKGANLAQSCARKLILTSGHLNDSRGHQNTIWHHIERIMIFD